MQLDNFIIEVTRKCNMACEHCLRGEAQNKDIKRETILKFLSDNNIDYISSVTFTGGEPSLNCQAIRDFIDICKGLKIGCGNFYIATNGKIVTDEFLFLCMELYIFCDENEMSAIDISRTDWHTEQDESGIEKLKTLRFCNEKSRLDYKYVISEGRGKQLNEWNGNINARKIDNITPLQIEDNYIPEMLYLNVKGDILTNCDISYRRQDKIKVGNIYNQNLIEMEAQQKELMEVC